MLRIAVVGDLSLQDPARLRKAMIFALASKPDILVQVGDMHPGYSEVRLINGGNILAVPGNHDTDWDTKVRWPRQWLKSLPLAHLVGLDNSQDRFVQADWDVLATLPQDSLPVIVFVHKPLSPIVLPDGSESTHIMGEGRLNVDAEQLKTYLHGRSVLFVHGHYHGWSLMKTDYGLCLIEGRGGAAPDIGCSFITIREEGIVIHQVTL